MYRRTFREQRGQSLVMVALMLVVLIGILALAVDAGNFHLVKRRMQNAADAGALAGALERCTNFDAADPDAPLRVADSFATEQQLRLADRADESHAEYVGGGNWQIRVPVAKGVDTFFAAVLGITHVTVTADATAECSANEGPTHLWPLTIRDDIFNDWHNKTCNLHQNNTYYIWDSDWKAECEPDGPYDCTAGGTYAPGSIVFDGEGEGYSGNRGWVDFGLEVPEPYRNPGCGAIQKLFDDGYMTSDEPPICISMKPGTVEVNVNKIIPDWLSRHTTPESHVVAIPVYDWRDGDADEGTCENSPDCGSDGKVYHATDWRCIEIAGPTVEHSSRTKLYNRYWLNDPDFKASDNCNKPAPLDPMGRDKCTEGTAMEIKIHCGTECFSNGPGGGGEPIPGEPIGVRLIE